MKRVSSRLKDPHCKLGYQYAESVITGKTPACLYVKQACQRAVDDYERKDWQYHFDQNLGGKVCRFIELLPLVKGDHVGQRLKLMPYQVFCITQIFGWVDHLDNRRFRRALIFVPRGNGKSGCASGIALYCLAAEGKQADIYCAATTADQAEIVFRSTQEMARQSPDLCRSLGIRINANDMEVPSKFSRFRYLSSKSQGLDGLIVYLGILDELSQHPDSRIFDVMTTGAGKRVSSLILSITTAGSNQIGPGYQQHEHLRSVLNGTIDDPQLFGVIYTLDEGDDWTDEAVIKKANPAWNVTVEPTYVLGLARKAQQVPTDRVAFMQKHLNVFTASDAPFIDIMAWTRCADPTLKIEDFYGEQCWIGLDLATKVDLSARVLVFRRMIDGERHLYLFARAYLPEAAVQSNAMYQGWRMQDRLAVTMGEVTDYQHILDDLKADCRNFDVRGIAVDPWQGGMVMQQLLQEGAPVKEFRVNVATVSNPMKELQAVTAAGQVHHDGDPIMSWCMGNIVAHFDQKQNVFPRRNLDSQKIDIGVAAIYAIALEMDDEAPADFDLLFIPFH